MTVDFGFARANQLSDSFTVSLQPYDTSSQVHVWCNYKLPFVFQSLHYKLKGEIINKICSAAVKRKQLTLEKFSEHGLFFLLASRDRKKRLSTTYMVTNISKQ